MFGVFQWTAKYDEAFCFQRVHERSMFSPSSLFSHQMVSVPPGSLFVYHDKVSHLLSTAVSTECLSAIGCLCGHAVVLGRCTLARSLSVSLSEGFRLYLSQLWFELGGHIANVPGIT